MPAVPVAPERDGMDDALSPAAGGCAFHMREAFSGLMAPLITKSMPDLTPTFEKFADGLTRLSEEAR